jgi:murein DD-endopeptidase MepM/ murein hydrolase activator NlpD
MEVEIVNMKKLFPDEKGTKKGVREFLDKKGFYIVLLLCIAVVAGTAVFVTTRNATSGQPDYEARNLPSEEDENAAADETVNSAVNAAGNEADKLNAQQPEDTQVTAAVQKQTDIGNPAVVTGTGDNSAVQSKDNAAKTTTPNENTTTPAKNTVPKTTTPKKAASVKQQSFEMPVIGEITVEFAKDKLVYSKTLEEWRAHTGVDIASDRGTPVKAVADGFISDVRDDSYYGITVVVDHGNGLQTLYRNLASTDTVAVNQKIKQGEVIGSIGNTAADESAEQAHLHFEVLKNNVSVDPLTYLPKSSVNVD